MGYTESQIEKNFGHFLPAFNYGTPPHGGIALGVDRLAMLKYGMDDLRAFFEPVNEAPPHVDVEAVL